MSFQPGTNADLAQVDVQNRLSRAAPRLPAAVTQQGVRVDKSRSNFLLFTMLASDNPEFTTVQLGDYAARNIQPDLQRVKGIGQVQLFGSETAMRIWLDPAKMQGVRLSSAEIAAAIRSQNAQVASGTIGDLPNVAGQGIAATVVVKGQLSSVEQFGNIVLRANADGSTVRLKDVARIELGGQSYATSARLNGQPAVGLGVQLAPGGNALESAKLIRTKMEELSRFFPEGREVDDSLRQLALRQHLDLAGDRDAAGGGGAGVPGDVPVPAELALHRDPHAGGADRAAGHLRHPAGAGLLDQRADHVRHGAGDRASWWTMPSWWWRTSSAS